MERINYELFKNELTCTYRNETYSVRDNGAIFRHQKINSRLRPLDNKWTFGRGNKRRGYMYISSTPVHRIVATAFLGEPPSKSHVVDHIDTNRRNNRLENLRWLTKLENILKNPFTLKKIALCCGSIEAFLENPSILKNHRDKDPNYEWMRTVNAQEAQASIKRLKKWESADIPNGKIIGVGFGEWLFQNNENYDSSEEESEFVISETSNSLQKDWLTPSEFPSCPQEVQNNNLTAYYAKLKRDDVFSINKYTTSIIEDFSLIKNGEGILVMCRAKEKDAIKPWLLSQITLENNFFIHTNLGSFFKKVGVEKQFTLQQGLEWNGEDSIDDYC